MKRYLYKKAVAALLACLMVLSGAIPGVAIGIEPTAHAAQLEGANLFVNGSFEAANAQGKPSGWDQIIMPVNGQKGVVDFAVSDSVYRDGAHAMQLSSNHTANPAGNRGLIKQQVMLTPEQTGKDYVFRQWMKTSDVAPGRAYARVQIYDAQGQRIGPLIESASLKNTEDWTLIEKQIAIPAHAVRIDWEGFLEFTTGTVWFDDVQLVELIDVEEPLDNLLKNGGFESSNNGVAEHWGNYKFSGAGLSPNMTFAIDDEVYRSGSQSYRIASDERARGTINQSVTFSEAQKNRDYLFEQWVKTEAFTGDAYIRVQIFDQAGTQIGYHASNKVRQADDWTKIQLVFSVPAGAHRMMAEAFFENGTGQIWYDDALIRQWHDEPLEVDLIQNGGFEDVAANGQPRDWSTHVFSQSANAPISFVVDNQVSYTGNRSYRLQADEQARATLVQRLTFNEAQRGKTYRMQQWVKTADFTGSIYLRAQVYNGPDGGDRIVYLISPSITQANDWTRIEQLVEIAPDATRMSFESFYENGKGTVWYDQTSMKEWVGIEQIMLPSAELQLAPGATHTLAAQVTPAHALDPELEWISADPAVASVVDGQITAHAAGITLVTVQATGLNAGKQASIIVMVGNAATLTVDDQAVSLEQDGLVSGQLTATGNAGAAVTFERLSLAGHGVANVQADGTWHYYPDLGYVGDDFFYVVARTASGAFGFARIDLQVVGTEPIPVMEKGIYPTDYDTPISGKVTVLSVHTTPLQYEIQQQPASGQVNLQADGSWTYTPNAGHVGNDFFLIRATNAKGGTGEIDVHVFTAPTSAALVDQLESLHPDQQHPRLLATESDFARIRGYLADNDPYVTPWFARLKGVADSLLPVAPHNYQKPDGLRLDTTSSNRIVTLAFVYQITGDAVYLDRAWEELAHVSSNAYPDWSPGHFLDTATMMYGVSLGYDWLYQGLSQTQRDTIRGAMVAKGLTPAVPMYLQRTSWWVYNRDNWNYVSNAGMTMGALAIADEEEIGGLILREALKSIQYGLPQYAPDGSAKEGPSYWEYGTRFLVFLLSALDTGLGHNFDFDQREGIAETAMYPIHITGPKGAFNYFDNSETLIPGRLLLWFANQYEEPAYTWYHQYALDKAIQPGFEDILWYRADTYGATPPSALDREFLVPHAVTMRSDWNDPNARFVGFKGGQNGAPHGDLDSGSFVFDANGVRWALDIGNENYNLPGFFNMAEQGERWTYYRKRTEGHNTLVIAPSTAPGQKVDAVSEISETVFNNPNGAYAIADLTPAYIQHAASVRRGTALVDQRRQFVVQDEITMKTPEELYWFMHTRADIDIDAAGTTAILSRDGRMLAVQIISPSVATFSILPAEPLSTSPNPSGQTRNLGVNRLAIHLQDVLQTTISVKMTPILDHSEIPVIDPSAVTPLDDWQIETTVAPQLSAIYLDGVALSEFSANRYVYDITRPSNGGAVPQVTVDVASAWHATVEQATQWPGIAKIRVSSVSNPALVSTYSVVFHTRLDISLPSEDRLITPIGVTASAHDGNVPENTIDGNLNTRWSAEREQWIQYDLGEVRDVTALAIAWYQGNVRASYYQIVLSEDGENWQAVYEGLSSGNTLELELTAFATQSARYVRINGFGNTANAWNSIAEVQIYAPESDEEEPEPEPLTGETLPATANLSDDNGHDTGLLDGDYSIQMNLWYGENANIYKLYENGQLVDTQSLQAVSPQAQTAVTVISGKANGTYRYEAELINAAGVTRSAVHTVTVKDATPGQPVLSHNNWDRDDSFTLRADLWWGTNATSYRLYENGELLHSEALTAATPQAQSAFYEVSGRAMGSYTYRIEFINEAGSTSSQPLTVSVAY